jgi:hypothetical protein
VDAVPLNSSGSFIYPDGSVSGGRPLHFVAGPTFAARSGNWAITASPRVGFVSYGKVPYFVPGTVTPGTSNIPLSTTVRDTFLVASASFGVERMVAKKVKVRLELGDEFRDYGQAQFRGLTPPTPWPDMWTSSLTFASGVSYSLGRPLRPEPPAVNVEPPHRFMDKTNVFLLTASLLAQTADAVTTQRFIRFGEHEGNAIARPLVEQGWPGQIALGALFTSAEVGTMYVMHRWGHHRVERLIPIIDAASSGSLAYLNAQAVPPPPTQ